MPPWLPEPGHGEFVGERRLPDDTIATHERWIDEGAAEGDPRDLPATPPLTDRLAARHAGSRRHHCREPYPLQPR